MIYQEDLIKALAIVLSSYRLDDDKSMEDLAKFLESECVAMIESYVRDSGIEISTNLGKEIVEKCFVMTFQELVNDGIFKKCNIYLKKNEIFFSIVISRYESIHFSIVIDKNYKVKDKQRIFRLDESKISDPYLYSDF